MSSLPYGDVVRALRSAGNRAGAIRAIAFGRALTNTAAVDVPTAALLFAQLAAGPAVDTLTAREIELELTALTPAARSVAQIVAPALSSLPEESLVVHRALIGIVGATSAIFGAMVPWAIAVDATLLQACREVTWEASQLTADKDRPKELARRVARAFGLPVIASQGLEDAATSDKRLRELDPVAKAEATRLRAIEQSIRSKLPKV
jgi:hypothetical protein